MSKSPWTPGRPPKRDIDWPMTLLIGGCVIAAAIVAGLYLSSVISP